MHDPTFQEVVEGATFWIGTLFDRFECEVCDIDPSETERIKYAFTALQHLRDAVSGTIDLLDELEQGMAPFREPVPPSTDTTDFEADVLRDIAALDDPKKRPVSANEVMAWSQDFIRRHWKV